MNILITGGVGFIGTNCALYFAKNKKNKITIVDNLSRTGVKKNLVFLSNKIPKVNIIKSDINIVKNYKNELVRADLIIHLAGQTAVTTSINNPSLDFKSNLMGSFSLLETLRKKNRKAILIYSSTNKIYGQLNNHQIVKDHLRKEFKDLCHLRGLSEEERIDFISPYGCSKGAADLYFLDYGRIFNMNTVVFRQSCIYGPHQIGIEDQGWLAHFSKQFILRKKITIYGNGYQVRDLLYIEDLIKAYNLAIKNINKIKGQVFNIGGGVKNSYSLLQVIAMLEELFGYKTQIIFSKERLGDQKYFVASNRKISQLLDWRPSTDFKTGLKKLVAWQKNNLTIKQ